MATKRLDSGWTLTCGVWPPFPLPSVTDVRSALREQGILRQERAGLDPVYERWVEAQEWTYALDFDCPDEEERASLRFEMLSGKGAVRLNGRTLTEFDRGELTVDITRDVQPEKNRLEVSIFPGVLGGFPWGILGPVWLRTTNYVELKRVRAASSEGVIKVASNLVAHTAGRFLFKYQVSLDGEMALSAEMHERLKAADARIEHALKLPSPVKWDGEQYYTVRLSVERSGVGCDSVLLNAAMDPRQPRRIVGAAEWRNRDLIRALHALGAEAVYDPERGNALVPFDLLPDGLLLTDASGWLNEYECGDLMALPEPRTLAKLAGSEKYWPPGSPVWRATGSPCPSQLDAEALYGPNALGDAGRFARLSRFAQAEAVRALALNARREGKAFALWAAEEKPALSSIAIIEHSGKNRPAYGALKQTWGDCAAFEFAEPFEASLPLKVWLYPKAAMRRPVTVTASVYRLDGSLIASTSFAAMSGEPALLGELRATLPEEGVVVARAELSDGAQTSRIDQVICLAKPDAPKRGALLNPPRAELRLVNGELSCAGQAVALGVFAGGFYGVLLPGEKIALPGGIAPEDIESLNGLIL
jgi:hypothetical protein